MSSQTLTIFLTILNKKIIPFVVLILILLAHNLVQAKAVDIKTQTVTHALTAEPPNLNSLRATDQISFFVIEHVMDGLLGYDENGVLTAAIAERWQMDDKRATFFLRKDALWSDGKKVTAHDFVFAWQTVLKPETASRYAFILSPVKNAEKILAGQLPANALGVRALDDFTLQVELERPCSYFLSLTTFPTYYPVREDFYKQHGEKYFSGVNHMLFNGPYVLSRWVHGAALRFEKNSHYWNKNAIQINVIDIPYITADPNVAFNLFRNNEIVLAGLDTDTIKFALQERMLIKKFILGAVFYVEFNHRETSIASNKNFRKAMQYVHDAEELVYKVIGLPGNKVTHSIFPSWLEGEHDKFYREYPPHKIEPDIEKAKAYLQAAKDELGVEHLPPVILLTSDSPLANKEAEYLQAFLKKHLDLDIKIDKQIFKQRLAKMTAGEFDIVLAGWGPDYNDPSTFGDLFYSKNSNNHGRYSNPEYDDWVERAMNNTESKTRMKAFAEMQRLLFEDAVVLPKFERGIVYVQHPKLKGLSRRIFGGDPSFRFAWIEE